MTTRVFIAGFVLAAGAFASDLSRARALYDRADYREALAVLMNSPEASAPEALELTGKACYQLGEYKRAVHDFEKAAAARPNDSNLQLWLGRAWGRRAETSNPFMAPAYASRARQRFERAVELDPRNHEAVNDLFSYYLEAPGFLGGGIDKARALAERIRGLDRAEYEYALAQIDERRKQFDSAEEHLRRAVELAPRQVGRIVDLARFLARRGNIKESEKTFERAAQVAPNHPKVLFARAETYIQTRRNLDEARRLLEQYLEAPLTPDDAPRAEALKLLKRAGG